MVRIKLVAEESIDWHEIPALELENVLWTPDAGIRAKAQICRTEDALRVHMTAAEKEISAEYFLPLSPVHEDSCLEFFFMPAGECRYMNFEMNPNGCLHVGFGQSRQQRAVIFRRDGEELFRIRTGRTADGWEIDYRIPYDFLRIFYPGFEPTGVLRCNFYKCGDKTVHPHFLSWHPVRSETPDFHRPEDFGEIMF